MKRKPSAPTRLKPLSEFPLVTSKEDVQEAIKRREAKEQKAKEKGLAFLKKNGYLAK
jgi:hypothetical protein